MKDFLQNLVTYTTLSEDDLAVIPEKDKKEVFKLFKESTDFWDKYSIIPTLSNIARKYHYANGFTDKVDRSQFLHDYELYLLLCEAMYEEPTERGYRKLDSIKESYPDFFESAETIDLTPDREIERIEDELDFTLALGPTVLNLSNRDIFLQLFAKRSKLTVADEVSLYIAQKVFLTSIVSAWPYVLADYACQSAALSVEEYLNAKPEDSLQDGFQEYLMLYSHPTDTGITEFVKAFPKRKDLHRVCDKLFWAKDHNCVDFVYPSVKVDTTNPVIKEFKVTLPEAVQSFISDMYNFNLSTTTTVFDDMRYMSVHFTQGRIAQFFNALQIGDMETAEEAIDATLNESHKDFMTELFCERKHSDLTHFEIAAICQSNYLLSQAFFGKDNSYAHSCWLMYHFCHYDNIEWYRPTIRCKDASKFLILTDRSGQRKKLSNHTIFICDGLVYDTTLEYLGYAIPLYLQEAFRAMNLQDICCDTILSIIPKDGIKDFPLKRKAFSKPNIVIDNMFGIFGDTVRCRNAESAEVWMQAYREVKSNV